VRRARVLILAAASVIAIAIAVVALLPSALDWNRYRGTLEFLASDALGRPVTIAGPVSLSLLPEPVLTASRVRVGGGGDGARIVVAELRLRVALMPLLSGQVDARELTLRQPDLRLPWPPRLGLPFVTPPWLAALSARIEDGRIEAGGFVLTHVDATLAEGRGDAALVLSGSAATDKGSWQFALRLGDQAADGNAPIEASLSGQDTAARTEARLTGALAPNGQISGHVAIEGPDLARLMAAPPLPFHLDGTILTGSGAVRLDGLQLTLGTVAATGGGTLALAPSPRLNLVLATEAAVPLDPWLAVLRAGGESLLPVGLTLAAPRATLARGLLQHVRLAVVLGPGGAEIGAFHAILPGEAGFTAEGRLAPAPGKGSAWEFMGTARLAAPALDTTLHWLEAAAPGVLPPLPARVLGAAGLTARVTIDDGRIALEDIAGTFDQSHVGGGISLGLGGAPAINAGLTLDRLDLDPWLNPWLGPSPPGLAALPSLFAGVSAELRLSVGEAELGRTEIGGLALDAASVPGPKGSQLIVRRLDATVAGVHAIASGTLGPKGVVTAGRLALTAPGMEAVAGMLPAPLGPALKRWKVPLSLDAAAAGPPGALHLTLKATLGNLRLTAAPVVDLGTGAWQGVVTLRHPGAAELIGALGLGDPSSWLGEGSLSLIAEAKGDPYAWALDDFRLIAGALTAGGRLGVTDGPNGPDLSGTIHLATLPMPPPDDRAPLPLALLTGWQGDLRFTAGKVLAGPHTALSDASGEVSAEGGVLSVEANCQPPGGGAVTSVLRIDANTAPPEVRLGAAFGGVPLAGGLFRTPLDLVGGTVSGRLALSGKGSSPAALVATLAGTAELAAQNGAISGISLGGVRTALAAAEGPDPQKSLAASLSGGRTAFTRLSLAASGSAGRFALSHAELAGNDGTMSATGSVDLPARSENLRLAVSALPKGTPEVLVRLVGPAAKPDRLLETTDALHWLAGRKKASP
jgi:hypothetical protein